MCAEFLDAGQRSATPAVGAGAAAVELRGEELVEDDLDVGWGLGVAFPAGGGVAQEAVRGEAGDELAEHLGGEGDVVELLDDARVPGDGVDAGARDAGAGSLASAAVVPGDLAGGGFGVGPQAARERDEGAVEAQKVGADVGCEVAGPVEQEPFDRLGNWLGSAADSKKEPVAAMEPGVR
ncbi:hypothetical protein [Amycolatopsis australiensis]|uniref:hypothetical protein n=1 Tax=Amycolatopsis australiensis TaxID=546364 RepID=UPI0009316ADB|nr:hypothetical protein [Amycolatopsis australiensis]